MGTEAEQTLREQARDLRNAAVHANRPDVAAKVDDILTLLDAPPTTTDARPGNAAIRVLDGLGF